MKTSIRIVWGCLFLALLVQLSSVQNDLPARIAVHFDASGNPNGYQTRDLFVRQFLLFAVILNGVFVVLTWALQFMTPAWINIPWKKYWFANEARKAQALEKLRWVLSGGGVFINAVLWITLQVIRQANGREVPVLLPGRWAAIVILALTALFVALIFFITRPSREPSGESRSGPDTRPGS